MTSLLDGNASRNLSAVVTFKSRDLVMPKGIDGGEMLAWASADELLALHLELASNAKAFWKDGFLLYTLWAMGDFCGMIPPGTVEETGTVKWFNADKGYGFIATRGGGKDVFVHISALDRSGIAALSEGQTVVVDIVEGRKGPEATRVRLN
jgi:cold shock CspA family protein